MASDRVHIDRLIDSNNNDRNIDEKINENKFKEIILLPYNYIIQNESKNICEVFIRAMNNWFRIPECYLNTIIESTTILHKASLILDDIEDNSEIRCGVPAAHKVFGMPFSINTCTYVTVSALDKLLKVFPQEKKIALTEIYCELLLKAHVGQGLDIYWRDNFQCPTEEEYLYMIDSKNAVFRYPYKLMQLMSEEKTDFSLFISLLGQYSQIRDDYLNLISEEYQKYKGFAEDLSEGKLSFPIFHAIKTSGNDPRILQTLRECPTDLKAKNTMIELLEKFGSISYTLERIKDLEEKCLEEVKKFGSNKEMIHMLNRLKI